MSRVAMVTTGHLLPASLLLALLSLLTPHKAWARNPRSLADSPSRALFVFGNSLTDTGEANYLPQSIFRADFAPNGIDALPASGRHSNGLLVTDFIADYLGIPTPPVYLSRPQDISKGVSFGTSGAGILNVTSGGAVNQTVPFSRQIDQFEALLKEHNISPKQVEASLFLVLIGNNDILELGPSLANLIPSRPSPLLLHTLADSYSAALQRLFTLGARRFLLCTLPDVGATPYARTLNGLLPSVAALLTDTTKQLNGLLAEAQEALKHQLEQEGAPGPCTFDAFAGLNELISRKDVYGFEETQSPCCGPPLPFQGLLPCGANINLGIVTINSSACTNRDGYIFWDFVHPTEKVYKAVADWWWKGGPFTKPSSGCGYLQE